MLCGGMGHTHHDALHPSKADRFWLGVSAWLHFCLLQPGLWPSLWQAIALLQVRCWCAKAAWVRLWDKGGRQVSVDFRQLSLEAVLWLSTQLETTVFSGFSQGLPGAVQSSQHQLWHQEAGDTVTHQRHIAGTSSMASGCWRCCG